MKRSHEIMLVIAIFTVIIFGFFHETIFEGKTYLPPDSRAVRSGTAPLKAYQEETGETPQWNPYMFGGMPAAGSLTYTRYTYFPDAIFDFFNHYPLTTVALIISIIVVYRIRKALMVTFVVCLGMIASAIMIPIGWFWKEKRR